MTIHTSISDPTPEQALDAIIGYRFIYTYANGWQYETYVKNGTTIDYRITETRCYPNSPDAHRAFRRYWIVIRDAQGGGTGGAIASNAEMNVWMGPSSISGDLAVGLESNLSNGV